MIQKLIVSTALSTVLMLSTPAFAEPALAENTNIVIAKVNGEPIFKKELEKIEKNLPPEILKKAREENKDKLFANLRDQVIDFKLMSDAAKKADLEKDPEVIAAFNQMKEQILLQAYIGKTINPLINDAALKAEYAEFLKTISKDETEIKVRHIMFNDKASAEKAIEALNNGADFAKLAREQSIDKSSAALGGVIGDGSGFIRKKDVDKNFAEAAFALSASGEITKKPVQSSMGWHVIKMEERQKVKPPTFEELKDQLGQSVFQKQMKKLVEQLRDKASIERFNADGKATVMESNDAMAQTPTTSMPTQTDKNAKPKSMRSE